MLYSDTKSTTDYIDANIIIIFMAQLFIITIIQSFEDDNVISQSDSNWPDM